MSREETRHPIARHRLGQLSAQISSLAHCLDVFVDAADSAAGSAWLSRAIASLASEVAKLIPDAKYFQNLELAGLDMRSPESVMSKLDSTLEMRCILALAAAAIEDVSAEQPPFGFGQK